MTEQIHIRARKFLQEFFNDHDLSTFCFDYFPQVFNDFTQGMTKNQKVLMLVSYSQRRERLEELLAALERERPEGYQKHFGENLRLFSPDPQVSKVIIRKPRQIFISHAHQDEEFAQRLAMDLQLNGWQTWMASNNIRPGEKWAEAIGRGLMGSGVFVQLLTPEAVASRWVQREMNSAIEMEHRGEIHLIPLHVKPTTIPALWGVYQWIAFDGEYETGLAAFLRELELRKVKPTVSWEDAQKKVSPTLIAEIPTEQLYPDSTKEQMIHYENWPFLPANAFTPNQAMRWWQECFLRTDSIRYFTTVSGSAILVGEAGSGKSVALRTLLYETADSMLHVPYPVQNWPKGARPWLPGRRHVSQLMAAAANEIIRLLKREPVRFHDCHEVLQEFLIWLIQKHLGRRTLVRLLQNINHATAFNIPIPARDGIEDIYPSDDHTADVRGQIDGLVELVQALGYDDGVMITIDLNEQEASLSGEDLSELFRLDLLENPDLVLRAALPQRVMLQTQIENRVSGYLRIIPIYLADGDIAEIVRRYLQVATDGQVSKLEELATIAVLNRARKEINTLYSAPTVAGWLHWTETILTQYLAQTNPMPLADAKAVALAYYQRHVPLRLMPDQMAVWRGPQLLSLDRQPFELLRTLFDLQGQPAPNALLQIASTQANLTTLIGRIRKIIEPIAKTNIYIHNTRDLGYWLENFA